MKIPMGVKLLALVLGSTLFYTWVGQLVPQKEVLPPEVVELDEDMTTAELVAIGQGIFNGKGLCSTCHDGGARFPDLDDIATVAATRQPGMDALTYLAQSVYRPDDYIVPGFNPGMPAVDKPPIGLSDGEILAVIAYLQTLGGEATMQVGMTLPYSSGAAAAGTASAATDDVALNAEAVLTDDPSGTPSAGAYTPGVADVATLAAGGAAGAAVPPILSRFGCGECHTLAPGGERSLAGVGSRLDRAAIRRWLTDHQPPLPATYTDRATLGDVRDITDYLVALKEQG